MDKTQKLLLFSLLSFFLVACGGSDGSDGADGYTLLTNKT